MASKFSFLKVSAAILEIKSLAEVTLAMFCVGNRLKQVWQKEGISDQTNWWQV